MLLILVILIVLVTLIVLITLITLVVSIALIIIIILNKKINNKMIIIIKFNAIISKYSIKLDREYRDKFISILDSFNTTLILIF